MGDTFEGCVDVRAPQDLKTKTHDRRAVALPAGKCIIRITQDLAVRCGGEQSCLRPPARNGPSYGIWLFWSYGVMELWSYGLEEETYCSRHERP